MSFWAEQYFHKINNPSQVVLEVHLLSNRMIEAFIPESDNTPQPEPLPHTTVH